MRRSDPQACPEADWYRSFRFLRQAVSLGGLPADRLHEIAFVGRSNSGKSSVINALTARRGLARSSRTPGRTRGLNVFVDAHERRLVDTPGYGFARVSRALRHQWGDMLQGYFAGRASLRGVVLVMDVRHTLREQDACLLELVRGFPLHVVLNKADKLSRSAGLCVLREVSRGLQADQVSVQLFSASKGTGVAELRQVSCGWLYPDAWPERRPGCANARGEAGVDPG